ncbi:hypothetical protein AVEN_112083-1 [Araneus ventricosus]|uniref:Uncharacterized protein n=1 Tax=Araneus ventricosus TaxID=182803 RepID=A0A4Y2NFB2_ARAVE|nr:hypothetical protein AVEN_112083-1 [Araneus ventricosus]
MISHETGPILDRSSLESGFECGTSGSEVETTAASSDANYLMERKCVSILKGQIVFEGLITLCSILTVEKRVKLGVPSAGTLRRKRDKRVSAYKGEDHVLNNIFRKRFAVYLILIPISR